MFILITRFQSKHELKKKMFYTYFSGLWKQKIGKQNSLGNICRPYKDNDSSTHIDIEEELENVLNNIENLNHSIVFFGDST